MFSPSSAQAALLAKYGPLPIFIPDFANLQIVQGLNMTERLTPPYGVRISPTFGIALGDTFKHNTTSFSSEITSISCAAAGAVGAFNFQYTDGTYIEANAGTAPTSSAVALLPEEYINGVSGYATSSQITSLHFSTSRRNITCGTGTEGSRFETEIPDGSRAVGFFGTANGGAVTSFGVQYAKLPALRTLANDASNITVTVFEPQLLITPGAANMWETNDQTALNAAKALAAKELSPIYDNIIENGNEAWVEAVPDPATNATFYISLGAPDAGGTAPAIWVYAIPVTVPGANITLAVHIGTFSPAGGFGSAHPHIIEGLAIGTEAAAVLAAIGGIVKWYNTYTALVTNAGTVLDAELDAIFQEATYTSALAEFFGVDAVTFNLLAASASAFPIGAIAIAIIVSVAFIIEKLDRDYSLAVNVYNFDPVNQWVVDDWASNNGDTSGGPFTTAVLAALNNTVDGPAGPLPTVKWAATWATYLFGNKDTIGDGVYIAMQAELGTAGSGEGFTFGYRIHATTEDNQMALMDGLTDLETFVNSADGVWHQAEALTIVNQATGQTIYANSPALSGVKNSSYILDIGIGLPRSSVTPPSGPSAPGFGQCGGQGWTGATSCVSGYVCTVDSAFFSQCLPAASTTTTTSSAPSSAPTAPQFGQCGGTDWTGATSCVLGYVCTMVNVFFSQCQPPPVLTGTPIPAFGQCGGVGWTGNSTCIAGYFCGLEGAFAPYPICLQLNNTTTTATTLLTQASSSSPSTHPTTTVSTVTQTSSSATSTRASTTSSSHATSTPTPTGTQAPAFGQCGGTGWTGATACIVGYVCIRANVPSSVNTLTNIMGDLKGR